MKFIQVFINLIIVILTVSCGSADHKKGEKIEYKSSKNNAPLTFPPDLSTDKINDAYPIPDYFAANTLSGYESTRNSQNSNAPYTSGVLPQYSDVQIVRVGAQRFIQTSSPPQVVWPKLRDFWLKTGFIIEKENATIGIMETNWAENRAEIADGPIRRLLARVMDTAYSTGARDKFHSRIERNATNKKTEIIISHQRMVEELKGDSTIWVQGKPQPALEGEIMARLLAHLGANKQKAQLARSINPPNVEQAILINSGGIPTLLVKHDFNNTWRLVGNALGRSGFVVEDLNNLAGIYYVRYEDPVAASQKTGFINKLFRKKKPQINKYLLQVRPSSTQDTKVILTDQANRPISVQTANRILKILHEQLR